MNTPKSTTVATGAFSGIPVAAVDFYEDLALHNTREWWQENRHIYDLNVRAPITELMLSLAAEFGEAKVYRPYRDARFSKDRTPLKDHQGAVIQVEDAVAYYFQVGASGVMVAGGWYAPLGRQLERYRQAVSGPLSAELRNLMKKLGKTFELDGRPMKTQPRGVDPDHPNLDLLRFKALTASRHYCDPDIYSVASFEKVVRKDFRALTPVIDWLADVVGPGVDPGDVT